MRAVRPQTQTIEGYRPVERRTVALLCAGLRGVAAASSAADPRLVLALAGEFFALVAQSVVEHGGSPIAAHHDAMLCAFARGTPAQSVRQSVRAAQQIQERFPAMTELWRTAHGLHAAVAQGVHLGPAIFGRTGVPGLEQYTAFGDSVTIAHALLERARAGEFVISDAAMGALAIANLDLHAEPLPPLALGRRPPIRIYGVLRETRLDSA